MLGVCLLDKLILCIKENTDKNILDYTDDELEKAQCLEVSYQELRLPSVLAFFDSCKFSKVVFKMKDNILTSNIEYLLSKAETVQFSHSGVQGNNLMKVLCNLYPEKAGAIRHAALLKHDMMEVV